MARDTYVKKENLEDVLAGIEKKVPKAVPSVILKKEVLWEGEGNTTGQVLTLLNDIENYDEVELALKTDYGDICSTTIDTIGELPYTIRVQWTYRDLSRVASARVTFTGGKNASITDAQNLSIVQLAKIIGIKYTYEKNIPNASPTVKGKAKLYDSLGNNEDGAITQKAATEAIHSMGSGIGDWTANTEYSQGISVIYNHVLYKCTADHTSGTTFAPTYWNKIGVDASGDTFTGDVEIDDHSLLIKDHELTKGTNPVETKTNSIKFVDSSGNDIGSINHSVDDNGVSTTEILANEYVDGDTTHKASIGVSMDAEGNATTSAPTTPEDSEGNQIVTADFLKDSLATKILKPWTANTEYKLNTKVVYSNDLYKCITAHTSGAEFDATNWQKIGVDREGDTFTGSVNIAGNNNKLIFNNDTTKGTPPSDTVYNDITFEDSVGGNTSHRYGILRHMLESNGDSTLMLRLYKNDAEATTRGDIILKVDSSGNITTLAPNATGSGSAPIMTTAGGTFTGDVELNKDNDNSVMYVKESGVTRGTNPTTEIQVGMYFQDSVDKSLAHRLGTVQHTLSTGGTSTTMMRAFRNAVGGTDNASILVRIDSAGNVSTSAPTPAATSNDTNIATTQWVKNYTSGTCTNTSSVYGGNIRWYKSGRMATITLFNVKTSTTSSSNIQLTTDAPRAITDMYMTAVTISGKSALVHVNATGSVVIYNNLTTTEGFFGTVSYPTSDVT